jgi:mevalonate kinase
MKSSSDLIFEIPSKTFVIGEYLAINGTASLLMSTEPSFVVKIIEDPLHGYHPDSPAGVLRRQLKLDKVGFRFLDPHQGLGGFGRSTAEYLSVYLYEQASRNPSLNITEDILNNLEDFVSKYQSYCGSSYRPSGADLVAQVCGGLCWYDGMNFTASSLAWPFPGYDIFIFHTGKKLATHEHLKDLKSKDFRALIPLLVASRTALDQKNLKVFCQSLDLYYDTLDELGLSDPSVRQAVMSLRQSPDVLAAKGCGAMGVDTVIVLAEKSAKSQLIQLAQTQDFQYISSLSQTHAGACMRRSV